MPPPTNRCVRGLFCCCHFFLLFFQFVTSEFPQPIATHFIINLLLLHYCYSVVPSQAFFDRSIGECRLVLRGTTVLLWHRGTIFLWYSMVPVPSPLRYFLVPRYHKYRGCSAQYLSVADTQQRTFVRLYCISTEIATFGLSSVIHR